MASKTGMPNPSSSDGNAKIEARLIEGLQTIRGDVAGDLNPVTNRRPGDALENLGGTVAIGRARED